MSPARALLAAAAAGSLLLTGAGPAAAAPRGEFALPDGFAPEGIDTGPGRMAYVGSLVDGSIYRFSLRTGEGEVVSEGPGTPSVGLETDPRGRLFVAGGPAGTARVVDTETGDVLADYALAEAPGFVNDVVVTDDAAYFTDSVNPVLYVLPLGRGGSLPDQEDVVRLPLTGDLQYVTEEGAFNANGIEVTPDGRGLLVVQSATGLLFRVDPRTGGTEQVDLDGELLTNGDGLTLDGRTLYAVQNRLNTLAVLHLARDGRSGRVEQRITDERFDVPTTVDDRGDRLYLVNARFGTEPTPETEYSVVSIDRP